MGYRFWQPVKLVAARAIHRLARYDCSPDSIAVLAGSHVVQAMTRVVELRGSRARSPSFSTPSASRSSALPFGNRLLGLGAPNRARAICWFPTVSAAQQVAWRTSSLIWKQSGIGLARSSLAMSK